MGPPATPTWKSVRIHGRCRLDARCRIDWVFIHHDWRARYNDGSADHDNGGGLLNNDWRGPIVVRVGFRPHSLELRYTALLRWPSPAR